MSHNEKRLLLILLAVSIISATAFNVASTQESMRTLADSEDKYTIAKRSIPILESENMEMRESIARMESQKKPNLNPSLIKPKDDLLTLSYRILTILKDNEIEIVRYAMNKSSNAESATYTVKASPASFIHFLQKVDTVPNELLINTCDFKIDDLTNEVEGQFNVGH